MDMYLCSYVCIYSYSIYTYAHIFQHFKLSLFTVGRGGLKLGQLKEQVPQNFSNALPRTKCVPRTRLLLNVTSLVTKMKG